MISVLLLIHRNEAFGTGDVDTATVFVESNVVGVASRGKAGDNFSIRRIHYDQHRRFAANDEQPLIFFVVCERGILFRYTHGPPRDHLHFLPVNDGDLRFIREIYKEARAGRFYRHRLDVVGLESNFAERFSSRQVHSGEERVVQWDVFASADYVEALSSPIVYDGI